MTISIRPGGQKAVQAALKVFHEDWESITWTIGDQGRDPVVVAGVTGVASTYLKLFAKRQMKAEEVVE